MLVEMRRVSEVRFYNVYKATVLLELWPEYNATHRRIRVSFADGGAIQRQDVATSGSFCLGADEYADLEMAVRHLSLDPEHPSLQQQAVERYWGEGLRSVARVRQELGVALENARIAVWEGTARVLREMTGEDQTFHLKMYRQRLMMRRVER